MSGSMSDSSQYSQGSQSSAPQQQLRRPASPTQDRPPHEIVRPRLEESATREAVRAADQLQPDEQPAEQPANERANAPVNEPARQGDQQANQPPNEVTDERAGLRAEIAEMTKAIAADRKERQRLNELAAAARNAAARNAEQEQLALQYEADARQIQIGLNMANERLNRLEARLDSAPAPAAAQGPVLLPDDNSLVKFWRALQDDQVTERVFRLDPVTNQMVEVNRDPDQPLQPNETRFLTLPDGVFWLGNYKLGSVLMVRSCYYGLFDAIINSLANAEHKNSWIVTGNPGIGKTFFSAYFVYRLFQQHPQLTVVYEPAQPGSDIRYRLQPNLTVHTGSIPLQSFSDQLSNLDPRTWYLVDGHPAGIYNAYTLLVTSPRKDILKELQKDSNPKMFMPVWSWDELLACIRQRNATQARLQAAEERFYRWGGIARHVLDGGLTLPQSEILLNLALNACNVKTVRNSVGQIAGEQDISHRVLHIKVLPDSFEASGLIFASNWVVDKFVTRALREERQKLLAFLRRSAWHPEHAANRGLIFENYVHQTIIQGGRFRVRDLSNAQAPVSILTIPPLTHVSFNHLGAVDLGDQSRYFQPLASNHPAIDAIISPNKFLQMTVSQDHPVKAQRLSEAIQRMPADRVPQLYFVVPADIFETFPEQPYHTTEGRAYQDPRLVPANVQNARQFALCIEFTIVPNQNPAAIV